MVVDLLGRRGKKVSVKGKHRSGWCVRATYKWWEEEEVVVVVVLLAHCK
jgi:hypothetical protein